MVMNFFSESFGRSAVGLWQTPAAPGFIRESTCSNYDLILRAQEGRRCRRQAGLQNGVTEEWIALLKTETLIPA